MKKQEKMNNFIEKIQKNFIHIKTFWIFYSLVVLGLFMFISYIYILFLRERLPKDIPFELTEFKFYIIVYICCIYLYIMKTILYPKAPLEIIVNFISLLSVPLKYFYQYVIHKFYRLHTKLKTEILSIIDTDSWSFIMNITFIYAIQLFPRMLLLLIFMVDIFYVHKIEVFYYFIFLGILPLMYHLFIYYLTYNLTEALKTLQEKFNNVRIYEEGFDDFGYEHNPNAIHHHTYVTIQEYITIKLEAYWAYGDNGEYIEYYALPFPTDSFYAEYLKQYNKTIKELTQDDITNFQIVNNLKAIFNSYMSEILSIKIFFDINQKALQSAYIPQIKLFIAFTYLCCWLYILFVSIHTLQELNITLMILNILEEYSKIPDQFSDASLFSICLYTTKQEKKDAVKFQQELEQELKTEKLKEKELEKKSKMKKYNKVNHEKNNIKYY